MDGKTLFREYQRGTISHRQMFEGLQALPSDQQQTFCGLTKETLRQSVKDGSLMRRVYETAQPALEKHDLMVRYDSVSGRYRL